MYLRPSNRWLDVFCGATAPQLAQCWDARDVSKAVMAFGRFARHPTELWVVSGCVCGVEAEN